MCVIKLVYCGHCRQFYQIPTYRPSKRLDFVTSTILVVPIQSVSTICFLILGKLNYLFLVKRGLVVKKIVLQRTAEFRESIGCVISLKKIPTNILL